MTSSTTPPTSSAKTLVYSPSVRVTIGTRKSGIIDVSDDLVSGQLTLHENQPHHFNFELANYSQKYSRLFTPDDRVSVQMCRIQWMQVFSGYLDTVPYFNAMPKSVSLGATCTLKRLQYHFWDPGSTNSVNLLTTLINQYKDDHDGGMKAITIGILNNVGGWPVENIHISNIPEKWFTFMKDLYTSVSPEIAIDTNDMSISPSIAGKSTLQLVGGLTSLTPIGPGTGELPPQASGPALAYGGSAGQGWPHVNGVMDMTAESVAAPVDDWYIAMDWPYCAIDANGGKIHNLSVADEVNAIAWWTNRYMLVANDVNQKVICVRAADWGPIGNQAFAMGLSPAAMTALGADGSTRLNVDFAPPSIQVLGGVALPAPAPSTLAPGGSNSPLAPPTPTAGAAPATPASGVYQNPMRDLQKSQGFSPERVDQGVDYAGQGPVYAVGPGVVNQSTTGAGWPGGGFVSYQLTAGPFAGRSIYIAENITPMVTVGQSVDSNTVICIQHLGSPNDETGWATGNTTQALAAVNGGYNGSTPTALGADFNNFLISLGAPSGTGPGPPTMGSLPAGWATSNGQAAATTPNTNGTGTVSGDGSDARGNGLFFNGAWQPPTDPDASRYTGEAAFLLDTPLFQDIQNYMTSAMRSFCSAPNGDFIGWFPDWFGHYGTAGIMTIHNIELQDFQITWSDLNLYTHEFVAGNPDVVSQGNSPILSNVDYTKMYSSFCTVEWPQILSTLLNTTSGDNVDPIFFDPQTILGYFGPRPKFTQTGTITSSNPRNLFWLACYNFMKDWAATFSTVVPMTFMPEIFPGILIQLKDFKVQMYVTDVTHSFDFAPGGGFTTTVQSIAPAAMDGSGFYGLVAAGSKVPPPPVVPPSTGPPTPPHVPPSVPGSGKGQQS